MAMRLAEYYISKESEAVETKVVASLANPGELVELGKVSLPSPARGSSPGIQWQRPFVQRAIVEFFQRKRASLGGFVFLAQGPPLPLPTK